MRIVWEDPNSYRLVENGEKIGGTVDKNTLM